MSPIFSGWWKAEAPQEVSLKDVEAARERIKDILPVTPLTFSPGLSSLVGRDVYIKWDNKFKTGAFKERGVCNVLACLPEQTRSRGVCAASAGNHALALSLHAARLGVPCRIVMPMHAPLVKVESTRQNRAEVILHGDNLDEAYEHAQALCRQDGFVFISPFDDTRVIAGQGTAALELLEQLDDFDAVFVPVGGGGYLSGIASVLRETDPDTFIVGVQSEWAVEGRAGMHAKVPAPAFAPTTIADGIAVKRIGKITGPILKEKVSKLVTATDSQIARAIMHLLEIERTVVEGAGAAGLAGLINTELPENCRKVVVFVCGSNIDMNVLQRLIVRDMGEQGRLLKFRASVPDRPGTLSATSLVVARTGANVLEVYHDRSCSPIPGNVDISFLLEVRNHAHGQEVLKTLLASGIAVVEL